MSVHVEYSVEDAARLPGLDEALERDMRNAIRERVDRTVFNGDDGANEAIADITGFFGTTGIGETTLTQGVS